MYPRSKRVPECNDLIDKLREKLEMKDFKIAKLYYRMEDYAAAIQCLNNALKEFPESPHREEILYLIFKSYHKYALKSVYDKKKERNNKALLTYNEFISQYPESEYLPEMKSLKEKAQKELTSLYQKTINK
jgi:outer membrane protein assembly factor BamD